MAEQTPTTKTQETKPQATAAKPSVKTASGKANAAKLRELGAQK